MAEINFLCVHKEYRNITVKKEGKDVKFSLAPLLISEVTRRVNLRNKWQAVIL